MNINRHNYEEFFILYMDNELSSEQRRMVELFAEKHPDLKEELNTFLHYKLTPDTNVVYTEKAELYKSNTTALITLANYEEWLLLYVDNELSFDQQKVVEDFIATNPTIFKELSLLQHTKLQQDEIVFPDKESLYRKEEKVRALPVRWWRAAAAILLVTLAITAVLQVNKKPAAENTEVAVLPVTEKEIKKDNRPVSESAPQESLVAEVTTEPIKTIEKRNTKKETASEYQLATYSPKKSVTTIATEKNNTQQQDAIANTTKKEDNNLPKPIYNPNIIDIPNNNTIALNSSNDPDKNSQKILTNKIVTNQNTSPSEYVQAATTLSDTDLATADGKKNKLRGLFRKVTRTFEKRTNIDPTNDDERLLVGGLAIKLK